MENSFKYDAFLAHCSADKTEVEVIAQKLEDEVNLRVFFDKWDIIPGRLSVEEIEKALSQSKSCVVFIGKDGLGPWQNYERQAALIKNIGDGIAGDCGTFLDILTSRIISVIREICHADQE
jgi:TIR domain